MYKPTLKLNFKNWMITTKFNNLRRKVIKSVVYSRNINLVCEVMNVVN